MPINKNTKTVIFTTIATLIIICSSYYLNSKKPIETKATEVSLTIPKKEKKEDLAIVLIFNDIKKTLNFTNIPLNQIIVVKGNKNIELSVDTYDDVQKLTVMKSKLQGDYELLVHNIKIEIKDQNIFLNGKSIEDTDSLVINDKGKIYLDGFINDWEVPMTRNSPPTLEEQAQSLQLKQKQEAEQKYFMAN